jgi:hypothetical protein
LPYEIDIDRSRHRVTVVGRDPVSLADALAVILRQATDHAWSYATLHDARAVTWVPTTDDLRTMIDCIHSLNDTHGPRGPMAFVASDKCLFGMARLYEFIGEREGLRINACSSVAAAEEFLSDSIVP